MNATPGTTVSFTDPQGRRITGTLIRSYGVGAVVIKQPDGRRRIALTSELRPARSTDEKTRRSRPAKHK